MARFCVNTCVIIVVKKIVNDKTSSHKPVGASINWLLYCAQGIGMNKNRTKRNRPDFDGNERGIYNHNKAILRKTSTVCALCGMPLDKTLKYPHPMSISIDHIVPVALGGRSTMDNLQATHLICNKEKGKKLLYFDKNEQKNTNFETKNAKNSTYLPQYIDWSNY